MFIQPRNYHLNIKFIRHLYNLFFLLSQLGFGQLVLIVHLLVKYSKCKALQAPANALHELSDKGD